VLPGAHVLDHFRFDLALTQEKKVSGTDSETVPDSAFFPYLAPNPERHKQE